MKTGSLLRLGVLCALAFIAFAGCTVIPNDMGYPTFNFSFSAEAKAYQEQQRVERNYRSSTNELTNPQ